LVAAGMDLVPKDDDVLEMRVIQNQEFWLTWKAMYKKTQDHQYIIIFSGLGASASQVR
jgi:hypothetical protein